MASMPDLPRAVQIDVKLRDQARRFVGQGSVRLRDDIRRAVVVEKELVEMRGGFVVREDERERGDLNIRQRDKLAREAAQRATVERRVAGREKRHGKGGGPDDLTT